MRLKTVCSLTVARPRFNGMAMNFFVMVRRARLRAARRWGWHPLDSRWAERIVDAARIRPGELVLDIGAGLGALTAPLVRAGARVIAVELHPVRADRLRRRFADDPVTVVRADAADLRLPTRPFRVVANPPYRISSALLNGCWPAGSRMTSADLVLQRPW